ncbi:MAG TPA: ribosome small subunit-dependent GTPase A [Polyangiaceae bacterium]
MNELARIAIDDGVAYVAWTEGGGGERSVRLDGKMLREVRTRGAPRPVVGDWVEISSDGLIVALRPRRTQLARKAAGLHDVEQVIAANVDLAFVAAGADGDVNERRLERYLALVHDGGVAPVVLLMKADACADLEAERARVRSVAAEVDVVAVSARTGQGVDEVARRISPGTLATLLGSSGVGKSTLVNRLLGQARQKVGDLRDDGKGRHTTTRREIVPLPGGGMLLDMPGMRELGLIDAEQGLGEAFPEVTALTVQCRFRDCQHTEEPGCAVRAALASGALDAPRFESWQKLRDELGQRRKPRR